MSSYSNFVLTNHGMGLLADLLGSAGELEFRYMAIGAGVYSLEEKDKAAIRNMSSLKDERQQANFLSIKKLENTEGVVELKAHFTNQEISDEYQMTEIGIYAGKKGAEEEVLYCVAFWEGTPDTMPDFTTGKIHDVKFKVLIGIGDVSNVTIAYTQDTYVLADDFLDHVDDNTIHLSKEKRECWDKKLGTTDNTGDNTVIFDSGDEDESESSINRWEDIAVVESGEKHSSLWEKFSLLVKNFRFLKKVLGTKDISKIGDGTLTGAIYELNTGIMGNVSFCKYNNINGVNTIYDHDRTREVILDCCRWDNMPLLVLVQNPTGTNEMLIIYDVGKPYVTALKITYYGDLYLYKHHSDGWNATQAIQTVPV